MKDTIIILLTFISGYVVSIGMVILMARLFFPLFTKEELKNRKHAITIPR